MTFNNLSFCLYLSIPFAKIVLSYNLYAATFMSFITRIGSSDNLSQFAEFETNVHSATYLCNVK